MYNLVKHIHDVCLHLIIRINVQLIIIYYNIMCLHDDNNILKYKILLVSDADPRVNDWPLMDSPFPTLIMVITYLYIVTYLGPKVMANRKPFKLNNILVLYNAGQVVFSFVMLWEVRPVAQIKISKINAYLHAVTFKRFEVVFRLIRNSPSTILKTRQLLHNKNKF